MEPWCLDGSMHFSMQGEMGVAGGDQSGATFKDSMCVESKQCSEAVNRVKMVGVAGKGLIRG